MLPLRRSLAPSSLLDDEEEQQKKRKALMRLLPAGIPAGVNEALPITRATPNILDAPPLIPTPVAPQETMAELGAPPVMVIRNNKQRPLRAVGGEDSLERSSALLEAQQGYKQPFSKKDFALQALFGFFGGGLPGAAVGAARYGLDPNFRNQVSMGRDIGNTESQIQRELITRGQTNDLLNDQSLRGYRDAQAHELITRIRNPPRAQTSRETLADGTVVLTERNPESGTFEPAMRDGQPIILSRPKAPAPKVKINVGGQELEVDPEAALGYYGNVGRREDAASEKQNERESLALAARDEFEQLKADEAAAGEEKNRAYAYLEELKRNPNTTEDDIRQATQEAMAANAYYRSFAGKKTAAQSKAKRYSSPIRITRATSRKPKSDPLGLFE